MACKWPYKLATGLITTVSGVRTLLITGRGQQCTDIHSNYTCSRFPIKIKLNDSFHSSPTFLSSNDFKSQFCFGWKFSKQTKIQQSKPGKPSGSVHLPPTSLTAPNLLQESFEVTCMTWYQATRPSPKFQSAGSCGERVEAPKTSSWACVSIYISYILDYVKLHNNIYI